MDPLTLGLIILAGKVCRSIGSGSSPAPSPVACRWCGNPISGNASQTPCCKATICPSCQPEWQRIGGNSCVICGHGRA